MNIGNRIKQYRKKRKISVDKLAEDTGISRSTLFRYENGSIEKIPTANLLLISRSLDVPFEVLTGEKSNKEVEKYIDAGVQMYNDLLHEFPEDTDTGKALRYFDEDLVQMIIKNSIQIALSAPAYTEKPFDISGTNFLRIHLYSAFNEYYQESVKTNQNLINKVLNSFTSEDDLYSYRDIDDEVQFPIQIDEIGLDMTLITNTYYASVEEPLMDEINIILEDARSRIESLKEKYADKPERIARHFLGFGHQEGHPFWEYTDGKEVVDHLKIPQEIKDIIIKQALETLEKEK